MDYRGYQHEPGDVVYCDIPYEDSKNEDYGGGFDWAAFWRWAESRPYPVYVSSYENAAHGEVVWRKEVVSSMCATNNNARRVEVVTVV